MFACRIKFWIAFVAVWCGAAVQPAYAKSIPMTAQHYLGRRYVYGGEGDFGFDCSGLVRTVFRHHGLYLPRTSHQQSKLGKRIASEQVQPGDLLFFSSFPGSKAITHVGIVIDYHHHMIHAAKGKSHVIVSRFDAPYYQRRLVVARRIHTQPKLAHKPPSLVASSNLGPHAHLRYR